MDRSLFPIDKQLEPFIRQSRIAKLAGIANIRHGSLPFSVGYHFLPSKMSRILIPPSAEMAATPRLSSVPSRPWAIPYPTRPPMAAMATTITMLSGFISIVLILLIAEVLRLARLYSLYVSNDRNVDFVRCCGVAV